MDGKGDGPYGKLVYTDLLRLFRKFVKKGPLRKSLREFLSVSGE